MKDIEKIIKKTNDNNIDKVNWTKAWSNKYPVLSTYQNKVDTKKYSSDIRRILDEIKEKYDYNELDAMLILKDILYHEWKDKKWKIFGGMNENSTGS